MPHDLLAQEFGDRVHFLVIYVREPHPAERYQYHTSDEQKMTYARDLVRSEGLRRRLLVDGLNGEVHLAYGAWPNMLYIVDAEGVIRLRQRWGDPIVVRSTLEALLAGKPVEPTTTRDFRVKGPLLRVLFRAGPTAVVDFFFKSGMSAGHAFKNLWAALTRRWSETRGE